MQQDRSLHSLDVFHMMKQIGKVMAIDRSIIAETKLLKIAALILDGKPRHPFEPLHQIQQRSADDRQTFQGILGPAFQADITRGDAQFFEMTRQSADIATDRHLIVIENDDQVVSFLTGIVEGFEGHAAS